jgi:hypothetical protein
MKWELKSQGFHGRCISASYLRQALGIESNPRNQYNDI